MSLRQIAMVAKFLNLSEPMAEKKMKIDMYEVSIHDCTQGKNSSQCFSFMIRQRKWPSLSRKNVEIQKSCYHGNLTPHFSSLN